MTYEHEYEHAFQWVIENIPMYHFDSYDEWQEEIFSSVRLRVLEDNPTFNRKLERKWISEFGSLNAGPKISIEQAEPIDNTPAFTKDSYANVRLPNSTFIPKTQNETELVLPQQYKSEQFKPTLENHIVENRPSIQLPYTRVEVEKEKVTFFQRLKRIFTVRRRKK